MATRKPSIAKTAAALTPEQKQALYSGSDWKLPEWARSQMPQLRAEFERAAIAEAGLPVSEFQYSHADSGTVVVSYRDSDAIQKLRDLRARYAETEATDYRGFETDGDRIFRLAEGWTTGGDELGWIYLNQDVVLAFVGHEIYVGNEQLRWAVIAKFDPRLAEKPLSKEEGQQLRNMAKKLRSSPGRPRIETDNPKTLAQRKWRAKND